AKWLPRRGKPALTPVRGVKLIPRGFCVSVNDEIFLDEKLERAVAFHVDRVAKMAVGGRKPRNYSAGLMMVVGCFVDLVANCELRHRKLLSESSRRLRHKIVNAS